MSFKSILNNERIVNTQVFDYIYNNHLFESSGHPLFNYKDPEEFNDILYKLVKIVDIMNGKLVTAKVDKYVRVYITDSISKKRTNSYNAIIYKGISISLNKLGFKDVINSQHSNLELNIINIVEENITEEDLDIIKTCASGEFTHQSNQVVIKDKFRNVSSDPNIMKINCYAINGKIILQSFLQVFLHEYLHFYESYNRTKSGKDNLLGFIRQPHFHKILKRDLKNFNFTEEEVDALWVVFYRLFNGEDNALIGSLFGSLIGNNISSLSDFESVKDKLNGFSEYNMIKNSIKILEDIDAEKLYDFLKTYPGFFKGIKQTENGLEKINRNVSTRPKESVKREFLSIVEKKVNKLYKNLMRFSSRYIEMMNAFDEKFINTSISD
jgi:hypothetical protein